MKTKNPKIALILLILTSLCLHTQAQPPEGIIYQAEARDAGGKLLASKNLDVKISILKDSPNGEIIWEEQHQVMTNQYGMFVLIIGNGLKTGGGQFEKISWGESAHFLNVRVKTGELPEWIDMGTSQFLSVPYALHAKTAGALILAPDNQLKSAKPGVPGQVWSLFGNRDSNADKDVLGTTDATDLVMVTSNEERLRITKEGDINMTKSLEIGENLRVKQNAYLNTVDGETVNYGPFTVEDESPAYLTGTLTVDGATELKDQLHLHGDGQFDANLKVDKNLTVEENVYLNTKDGETVNHGPFTVEDESPAYLTGTLTVDGATELKDQLHLHGDGQFDANLKINNNLTVENESYMNGPVTINAAPGLTGGESDYTAYPLRVGGGNQGIAIKVNAGTPNNSNNFVTFFDQSNNVRGRIEGETTGELLTNPEYIVENAFYAANITINTVELGIAIAEEVQAVAALAAAGSSVTACTGGGVGLGAVVVEVVCLPIASLIAEATTELVLKTANVVAAGANEALAIAEAAAYNVFKHTQIGVTYQSGAGDYAEWLPKLNSGDDFLPGEVVGVSAGVISHQTDKAENFMVISANPIILGNAPEPGKESEYEKIAFMGQVPVKVYGTVSKGDYIVPSGHNDGFGVAVHPEDMKPDDYLKIVGIAWSESATEQLNYVNVAVGINANDVTRLVITQEEKIKEQEKEIGALSSRLDEMEAVLARLDCDYEERLKNRAEQPGFIAATAPEKFPEPKEREVLYHRITKEQLLEGITLAEQKLKEKGIDVDKHPFFSKLKNDSEYKDNYLNSILNSIEKEFQARADLDKKDGISTTIK